MEPASPTERVKTEARALGFDVVGIARADLPLAEDHARYARFLADGMHGEMAWLARDAAVRERLDGPGILEGARSVVCLARRYDRPEGERKDPPFARSLARYARGRDYHNTIRKRLRQLAVFLRGLEGGVRARPMVDDAPVLERAWAARAGLGFVGKNGMLIVPGQGSYVLLGEVVTTLALDPDSPIPERCGACRLCLDACPTEAFVRPFVLDARRCVAYLTIELRGPIDPSLREGVGGKLFGCDVCQEVCPFNRSRRDDADAAWLAPHRRWTSARIEDALDPSGATFEAWAAGSPLHRATAAGLARNAAIVLGNSGDAGALPALSTAAATHADPVVREAAAWARVRVETQATHPASLVRK
jgi:epoxyqueuosine reductase